MIDSQRTTDTDITDHLMTMRDALLAAKAEGKELDDVIQDFNRAIQKRMLRIMRGSAA